MKKGKQVRVKYVGKRRGEERYSERFKENGGWMTFSMWITSIAWSIVVEEMREGYGIPYVFLMTLIIGGAIVVINFSLLDYFQYKKHKVYEVTT